MDKQGGAESNQGRREEYVKYETLHIQQQKRLVKELNCKNRYTYRKGEKNEGRLKRSLGKYQNIFERTKGQGVSKETAAC